MFIYSGKTPRRVTGNPAGEQSCGTRFTGWCGHKIQVAVVAAAMLVSPAVWSQSATLVRSTATSAWYPPSPDPAGVTYIDSLNALMVSDSEVNEMPIFTGDNLFQASLNGNLQQSLTSIGFTHEPTGITYNPFNHHLFICMDNSPRHVYELDPGPDGLYDTADDILSSFATTDFGSNDAEGIAFNISQGTLHVVDGINSEVYTVDPGSNGVFDGVAPVGDDVVSQFDTQSLGVSDPEGIAYDADFGHLYIIGKPRTSVAHVTVSGELLRTIDISAAGPDKPAGLVYAPASSPSSQNNNLYIVDRGVDNNSDPNENDGRLYELSLPAFSGNAPPVVTINAPGNGASFVIGDAVTFSASAIDPEDGDISFATIWNSNLEGLIGQGASISTTSLSAGTHAVTASVSDSGGFSAENTVSVTITLTPNAPPSVAISSPANGSSWLTSDGISFVASASDTEDGDLSAAVAWDSDIDGPLGTGSVITTLSEGVHAITAQVVDSGGLPGSDVIAVTVSEPGGNTVFVDYGVAASHDDAEEKSSGSVSLTSSDLELVVDGVKQQTVGVRFANVFVPQGAGIVDAYIQFQVDEADSVNTDLVIQAHAADQSAVFTNTTNNITSRDTTLSVVPWSPPAWTTVGQAAAAQRTPQLALPLQEIVSRAGWASGNAVSFILHGSGERTAESADGESGAEPRLHIEYTTQNLPPQIEAGNDLSVSVLDTVNLAGSVLDDGLPTPPGAVSTLWSQVSGPGVTVFGDPTALTSTVSFTEVGSYQLDLTGSDGQLQGIDRVAVTVTASAGNSAPVVDAGSDILLEIGQVANLAGSVTDDGLPNPPASVVINWGQVSGPGTASFGNSAAAVTDATFSLPGDYVLELSADDGELQDDDQLVATVLDTGGIGTLDIAVSAGSDDAEQKPVRRASLSSSDLELVFDKENQFVGMRFNGVNIPPNANITNAYIQFQTDEVSTGPATLDIEGEDVDNALTFVNVNENISSRVRTSASINWIPAPWDTVGESGPEQQTPDLSPIIQEIVNRAGWISGNSLVVIVTGSGERVAESYNGSVGGAPSLHVEFQSGS